MFSASKEKEVETQGKVVDATHEAYKAGRKVRDFVVHANEDIQHKAEAVTRQIKDRPVEASIVALAAGFLLGAIFRPRR